MATCKGAFRAILVIVVVVVAAFSGTAVGSFMRDYRKCFRDCQSGCESEGNGYTFCEMKCDADCLTKESAAKLNAKH